MGGEEGGEGKGKKVMNRARMARSSLVSEARTKQRIYPPLEISFI
jgi:hypothetical protein